MEAQVVLVVPFYAHLAAAFLPSAFLLCLEADMLYSQPTGTIEV